MALNPKLFEKYTEDQLIAMHEAGAEVLECFRVLARAKSNTVAEVLRNQGEFLQWDHFPKGDVVDWETHSQYYYHAHTKEGRPGEHGHFHTFMRYKGMSKKLKPMALEIPQEDNDDRIGSHLIGISMDKKGFPIKLFTTNRWITDETWYTCEDVISMLDDFEIDHTYPSWATNRWLTGMVRLFRAQIEDLILKRDKKIKMWQKKHPGKDVFEDRDLEVLSQCKVSV
ncbi:MAG: DUF6969 family protein, partial [Alphaproteobacteria bacterium]